MQQRNPQSSLRRFRSDGNKITKSERRRRLKAKAVKMLGGRCILCGYDKYQGVLTFHHLEPSKKLITIADERSISWRDMEKEVEKCVLLCMNCHKEVEDGVSSLKGESDVLSV